jgi:hypothetical protein
MLFAEMHGWLPGERDGWGIVHALARVESPMTAPTTQPPSWFGRAVTDYVRWLSQHWTQSEGFTVIRELERLGLCTLLNNEDYVLAMVSALGDCRDPEPRATAIRADPEIRDTLIKDNLPTTRRPYQGPTQCSRHHRPGE